MAAAGLVEEPGDLLLGVPEAKTSLSASLVGSAWSNTEVSDGEALTPDGGDLNNVMTE